MSRSYGKGLRRSTTEKTAHRLGAHHLLDTGAVPHGSATLKPCQRMDQGSSGCCHSHSAVAALWCALNAAGKVPAFVGSPRCLASCTYADVRAAATPAGQPLPTLQDTGADLQDDATALAKWGVAPIQAPTSDGRFSDVENDPPDNTFPEPDINQLSVAGADLVSGEYQIAVDDNAPKTVALCLDAGVPVWLGFFVDGSFENLGASDVAQAPDQNDPSGGGHAVYINSYRTNAAGKLEFLVQNSWGSGWADGGAVWASEAWLKACWMLWPMAVAS
jgi:hypothetical protein